MLSASHRLTDGASFRETVRRGRRASSRALVAHAWCVDDVESADGVATARPARVGLVVGRAVGGSVVRNQVKRRLRHLMRARVDSLPAGAQVVVRALPASASASSVLLGRDLDAVLARVLP